MISRSLFLVAWCILHHGYGFLVPARLSSMRGAQGSPSTGLSTCRSVQVVSRSRVASTLTRMSASTSATEAAILKYKNFIGSKRWEALGEPEEQSAIAFREISKIYGEENAIKMVRVLRRAQLPNGLPSALNSSSALASSSPPNSGSLSFLHCPS